MIEVAPGGNSVTGFYRGIVKAHSDCGKCKIFWPGCMPEEFNAPDKVDMLPDAEQATSLFMLGSGLVENYGNGLFYYPEIGSIVWGFFENEDVNHPVYFAGTMMNNEENANVYNDLTKNKQKSVFKLKTPDGTLKLTVNDGNTWLVLDSEKKLPGSSKNDVVSTITVSKYGTVEVNAPEGNFQINAMNIKLNASQTLSINAGKILSATSEQQTRIESSGHTSILGRFGACIRGLIEKIWAP